MAALKRRCDVCRRWFNETEVNWIAGRYIDCAECGHSHEMFSCMPCLRADKELFKYWIEQIGPVRESVLAELAADDEYASWSK